MYNIFIINKYSYKVILKEKNLKKILRTTIYFTIILIVAKFIVYKLSGSLAIFSLLVDSFFDFIGSFISFSAYEYSLKDKTEKYRYGFYGIVDIATVFISSLVLVTVFFIYKQAIEHILHKSMLNYDLSTIFIMFLSTVISIIISYYLKIVYNKSKLLILKGEIAHYKADGYTNGSILISILVCRFVYNHYLIDPIIAIIIGYVVAKPAIEILKEALNNILSKEIDDEIKNKIIDILKNENNVLGYHNFKTRKSGERIFIQIYIEINKNLTFEKAHEIVENLEILVENKIENSEIIIHACPR